MDSYWLWPLGLVAILLAWPGLRVLVYRVLKKELHAQGIAAQPDQIHLARVAEPRWRNGQSRAAADRQLANAGFAEAGTWLVREMPDLVIGLYAHPAESAYAMLYDHPRSGFWAEFVTRYQDGTLATYTTLEPMELDLPEGSVHVSEPSSSLADLWKRMLASRPRKGMLACSRAQAAADFERGYAESIAHHKRGAAPADEARDGRELKQAA